MAVIDVYNLQREKRAFKLPKETEEQQKARTAAIQVATLNAANVPLHTVKNAVKIIELALKCAEVGNLNAISDAASGLTMAKAGLAAAAYNVRINVKALQNPSAGDVYLVELKEMEARAGKAEVRLAEVMKERGGVSSE